jgi:hypothetical protein
MWSWLALAWIVLKHTLYQDVLFSFVEDPEAAAAHRICWMPWKEGNKQSSDADRKDAFDQEKLEE